MVPIRKYSKHTIYCVGKSNFENIMFIRLNNKYDEHQPNCVMRVTKKTS